MTATIKSIIKGSVNHVFRRCAIKRLQLDGTYESSWFDVSQYVVKYPIIKMSYNDTVFLGDYQIEGGQISFNNTKRKFNSETTAESLFNGFLTRYSTKVKIECGFIDSDDNEVAGLTFYGLFYSEPQNSDKGVITFSIASIIKVLQNYPAYGIATTAGTTAEVVQRIIERQINGTYIFDKFFEGGVAGALYNPSGASLTTCGSISIPENKSSWDKISDYSFIDDFFAYINSSGNFVFDKKTPTADIKWVFNGAGSISNDYAINIVSVDAEREGANNIWTRVAITYDNNNNIVVGEETWVPGDVLNYPYQNKYGERTYSKTILDLNSSQALAVAQNLQSNYKVPHREWDISTVLIPHLNLNDRVQINYQGQYSQTNPFVVGVSLLGGSDLLGSYLGSIDLQSVEATIIGMEINMNLNEMGSKFKLREIVS